MQGKKFKMMKNEESGVRHLICSVPTKRWIIIELMNFFLLAYYLVIKRIHKECDVINFHIAYPQLTFWSILKYFVSKPVVVSEHWSAYHHNFGTKKKLPRIQRIFRHGLPLIAVSRALLKDIETFSGSKLQASFVIPNAVDTGVFTRHETLVVDMHSFLMISQWKPPKRPDVVIKAFAKLKQTEPDTDFRLRIGGYGVQLDEMKCLVNSLNLSKSVVFLGTLDCTDIAIEMNQCAAFLHCSDYETFSVVCAESICCGTPVIASAVGGITEFIDNANGKLVIDNTESEWFSFLRNFNSNTFNRKTISTNAAAKFSTEAVGNRYFDTLKDISCVKG